MQWARMTTLAEHFAILLLLIIGSGGSVWSQDFFPERVPAQFMPFEGAEWLERHDRATQEKPDDLIAAMQLRSGDVVADIGCGSGYFTRRIARKVAPNGLVYAVDIQPEMLDIMQDLVNNEGLKGVIPVQGEPAHPKLPSMSVDWMLLVDVYHEFSEWGQMLQGMQAALAPGGKVALVEYRSEDGTGDHIKADHRMSARQVLSEWKPAGFKLADLLEFLPSQHIFIFQGKNGRGPVIEDHDLLDALDRKLIEARATAAAAYEVKIQIKRKVPRRILITAAVGTHFQSQGRGSNMVARRDGVIDLNDDSTREWTILAASSEWSAPVPKAQSALEVEPPSRKRTLSHLLYFLQASPLAPPAVQAAVWIQGGNIDFDQLQTHLKKGSLGLEDTVTLALMFCDRFGLDVTKARVWTDLDRLMEGVREVHTQAWLRSKMEAP